MYQRSIAQSVVTGCPVRTIARVTHHACGHCVLGVQPSIIENVQSAGEVILVRAMTPGRAVACPDRGTETTAGTSMTSGWRRPWCGRAGSNGVVGADRHHIAHRALADAAAQLAAAIHFIAGAAPPQRGKRAETTLERWQQVHDLLGKGSLLECARRLDLSLNTVKRYARAEQPERLRRAPQYRPTLVQPLPRPPAQAPRRGPRGAGPAAVAGDQGARLPGSSNLLVRYITQGRAEADRPHLSPRRAACPGAPSRAATPARTPAELAWAMTAPGSCSRSTPPPPAAGGWTCTNSGTPQPPISATRSPPPADHGQDPAQVPAHRHALRQARRRSRGRGHQPARPAKADSLTTEQLCSSPGRPRSSAGLPWLFPMCTEAARLPWRVDASLLGKGHPVNDCSPCRVVA